MTFKLSASSEKVLLGVHPDLVLCVRRALGYGLMDFAVVQGVRTKAQQAELYAQGRTKPGKIVTWTMESNHLVKADGYGHAVDLCPFVNGALDWNNEGNFKYLATLMLRAAIEVNAVIEWGGHFKNNKDYPHFQLIE